MRRTIFCGGSLLLALGAAMTLFAAASPGVPDLRGAGDREKAAGKWDAAAKAYEAARQVAAEIHDQKAEASAPVGMADAEYHREHDDRAGSLAAEALELGKKTGALVTEADALK